MLTLQNMLDLNSPLLDDNFLASTADLIGLLSQIAAPTRRKSARIRQEAQLARQGLCCLIPNAVPDDLLPVLYADPPKAAPPKFEPAPAPTDRHMKSSVPHTRRRERCKCGRCKWCLDEARWERIFNEKFADKNYYGGLRIRQNSTLAGVL